MTEILKRPVLVADDQLSSRAILKKVFAEDYEVLEAATGKETLEILHARTDTAVVLLDIFMPEIDGFGVLAAMQNDKTLKNIPVVVMTASTDDATQMKALSSGAMDVLNKPINPLVTRKRVGNLIAGMDSVRLSERNRAIERELRKAEIDVVSGIYNKNTFLRRATQYLREHPDGEFILMRWDMDNFKVYNDVFDSAAGDDYLRKVGDYYRKNGNALPGMRLYARYEADHFVCLRDASCFDAEKTAAKLSGLVQTLKTRQFDYTTRIGLYRIEDKSMDVALMCDRALLALQSIKNTYGNGYAWYKSSMRDQLVQEHEIVKEMKGL